MSEHQKSVGAKRQSQNFPHYIGIRHGIDKELDGESEIDSVQSSDVAQDK